MRIKRIKVRLFVGWIIAFIVLLVLVNLIWRAIVDNQYVVSVDEKSRFLDRYYEPPPFLFVEPRFTILTTSFTRNLPILRLILEGSVSIIKVPDALSRDIFERCSKIRTKPPSLMNHQHSLEIRFPSLLRHMSSINSNSSGLWRPLMTSDVHTESISRADRSVAPLVYYIESYAYHAIYCTTKKRGKEDWKQRDTYWTRLSEYLISQPEWMANLGVDFLIPASHPLAGPHRIHPQSLNYLHRSTFMRTDFDVSGSSPKDVIVPYYADAMIKADGHPIIRSNLARGGRYARGRNKTAINTRNVIQNFIFFSGSDSPVKGFRRRLGEAFLNYTHEVGVDDIIYSHNRISHYMEAMAHSLFCLVVRGDTTSSRRFFSAINAGCLPVIISDWLRLPFDRFIDYSAFILRYPESVVNDISGLVRSLRSLPASIIKTMQHNIREARHLLLYDARLPHTTAPSMKAVQESEPATRRNQSALNPVTLALAEVILNRISYCDGLKSGGFELSTMCLELHRRVDRAERLTQTTLQDI